MFVNTNIMRIFLSKKYKSLRHAIRSTSDKENVTEKNFQQIIYAKTSYLLTYLN